jgi:hypothetical protein
MQLFAPDEVVRSLTLPRKPQCGQTDVTISKQDEM